MSIFFILFFIGSLSLNVVLVWYIIKLLTKLFFIQDNMEGLISLNQNFGDHLKELNELEMYYGDETLNGLLKHSKYVAEQIDVFAEILSGLDVAEGAEEQPEEEEQE
tara:strand:+ start:1493 stop:1813 length:321 start_codon:yes stop_codon:yes gene_type:complete